MEITTKEGKHGLIRFNTVTYAIHEKVRAIPGRKKWRNSDELWFEMTTPVIQYILFAFPNADWIDHDPFEQMDTMKKQEEEVKLLKSQEIELPKEFYKWPFKTKPRDHQAKAFFISRDKNLFGLFMEMGTGKTKVILDSAAYQYQAGEIDTLFVVAPNGVHTQWVNEEIPKHLPDFCNAKAIAWTSRKTKAWEADWEEVFNWKDGLRIFSFNIDAFSQKEGKAIKEARKIMTSGETFMAIDESSRIKSFSSIRTKQLLSIAPLAKIRRILSGTPISQGIEDLYTQFKFLDDGILGFSTKSAFEDHYCIKRGIPGAPAHVQKIVAYQNVDEIKERLDGYTFRVTKDECMDLPEKQYMPRFVELTPEQKKLYRDIRQEAEVEVQSIVGSTQLIDVQRAITKLVKLQQVVCGFIRDEDGVDHPIPSNRVRTCIEAVEEAAGKVIIWTRFAHDVKILSEALTKAKISHALYHGGQDQKTADNYLKAFKEDPDIKVLISNSQKGGIGLNLTCASTCIYFSNNFNAEIRWQSEDRIHRHGQENHCVYVDLIAQGTIDNQILAALREKKNVADSVLDVKNILETDQLSLF
jgi:SNF2 family DNA or RNA helicase